MNLVFEKWKSTLDDIEKFIKKYRKKRMKQICQGYLFDEEDEKLLQDFVKYPEVEIGLIKIELENKIRIQYRMYFLVAHIDL